MTAASRPQAVRLRSGDVVLVRQVRPGDAPALARAYASLGEQSRYRPFFTAVPELPESVLEDLTEIDHQDREVLVAVPPLSSEIAGGASSSATRTARTRPRWRSRWSMPGRTAGSLRRCSRD